MVAGGWRPTSSRPDVHTRRYGLRLFDEPSVLTGKHATVIYEAVEATNDAQQILADSDEVVPHLTELYGTDRAAAHPIVFVVDSRAQGESLSGVKIVRKEVPQGFVINGVAYIEWPAWTAGDILEQDGTIAHELTHVASVGMLGALAAQPDRGAGDVRGGRLPARAGRASAARPDRDGVRARRLPQHPDLGAAGDRLGPRQSARRSTSATRTARR